MTVKVVGDSVVGDEPQIIITACTALGLGASYYSKRCGSVCAGFVGVAVAGICGASAYELYLYNDCTVPELYQHGTE